MTTFKLPDELVEAYNDFEAARIMYCAGLYCLRKFRRYYRRFVKLHKKFIYDLGGK